MKTLKVYGASDDLIETEGINGCDEFSAYGYGKYHVGHMVVRSKATKESIIIHAIYNGYWCFAVGSDNGDDFDKFPNWKMERQWGSDIAYSETLLIEVPDDSKLKFIREKD